VVVRDNAALARRQKRKARKRKETERNLNHTLHWVGLDVNNDI
jgi:hypothetical protein